MAITNTRTVQRVEVYGAQNGESDPTVMVLYTHTFDDTSDDDLPVKSNKTKHLKRYIVTVNDEGEETSTATDISGEDQLVQDICAAIWTD